MNDAIHEAGDYLVQFSFLLGQTKFCCCSIEWM